MTDYRPLQDQSIADFKTSVQTWWKRMSRSWNFAVISGTFTSNSPVPGSVAWASVVVQYHTRQFQITDGNTSDAYLYWDGGSTPTTISHTNTYPTLGSDNAYVGTNVAGTFVRYDAVQPDNTGTVFAWEVRMPPSKATASDLFIGGWLTADKYHNITLATGDPTAARCVIWMVHDTAIYFKVKNSTVLTIDATGLKITNASTGIALEAGDTVDGVDVSQLGSDYSAHALATEAHGSSGAIVGATTLSGHTSATEAHGSSGAIVGATTLSGHTSATSAHGATGDIIGATTLNLHVNATEAHGASGNIVGATTLGNHTTASSGVHGLTGTVVGTSDAQTLTNKIIDSNATGKGIKVRHFTSAPTWGSEAQGVFTSDISTVRRIGFYDGAHTFSIVLPDVDAI